MSQIIDTLLLLALPASGKSEVRRFLTSADANTMARDFHLGPNVQLDDFPYVHMMRRCDAALRSTAASAVFFHADDKPFRDPRDWGTLIELVNEDHADLVSKRRIETASAATWLLERIDAARRKVGAAPFFSTLAAASRTKVVGDLESEARDLLNERNANIPESLAGKTVVIEFARGGPHGSAMPLASPFGYAYSLARLSPAILERAGILYIWVTPEESRRKNTARTDPNDPGSILHHGVPMDVMMNDYGCDDMAHLIETSGRADHVRIEAHGRSFLLPVSRFDNRVDRTSFVRNDPKAWRPDEVKALRDGLAGGLTRLASLRAK